MNLSFENPHDTVLPLKALALASNVKNSWPNNTYFDHSSLSVDSNVALKSEGQKHLKSDETKMKNKFVQSMFFKTRLTLSILLVIICFNGALAQIDNLHEISLEEGQKILLVGGPATISSVKPAFEDLLQNSDFPDVTVNTWETYGFVEDYYIDRETPQDTNEAMDAVLDADLVVYFPGAYATLFAEQLFENLYCFHKLTKGTDTKVITVALWQKKVISNSFPSGLTNIVGPMSSVSLSQDYHYRFPKEHAYRAAKAFNFNVVPAGSVMKKVVDSLDFEYAEIIGGNDNKNEVAVLVSLSLLHYLSQGNISISNLPDGFDSDLNSFIKEELLNAADHEQNIKQPTLRESGAMSYILPFGYNKSNLKAIDFGNSTSNGIFNSRAKEMLKVDFTLNYTHKGGDNVKDKMEGNLNENNVYDVIMASQYPSQSLKWYFAKSQTNYGQDSAYHIGVAKNLKNELDVFNNLNVLAFKEVNIAFNNSYFRAIPMSYIMARAWEEAPDALPNPPANLKKKIPLVGGHYSLFMQSAAAAATYSIITGKHALPAYEQTNLMNAQALNNWFKKAQNAYAINLGSEVILQLSLQTLDINSELEELPEEDEPTPESPIQSGGEYEAEDANLIGGLEVSFCEGFSGGAAVKKSNSGVDKGIMFDNISVEQDGLYAITFTYLSENDYTLKVDVNDSAVLNESVTKTGEFCFKGGEVDTVTFQVELNEGMNSLFIYDSPIIDKIRVTKEDTVLPENDIPIQSGGEYEAEDANLIGGLEVSFCEGFSGGAAVKKSNSGVDKGIMFDNISVEQDGLYAITFTYLSENDYTLKVDVNDSAVLNESVTKTGEFCFKGGEVDTVTFQVELNEGMNSLFIYDSPIIDKIRVTKEDTVLPENDIPIQSGGEYEAEDALIDSGASIVDCDAASEGQMVKGIDNGISQSLTFNNINVAHNSIYELDIQYYSVEDRTMTYMINDWTPIDLDINSTGLWCYQGGSPGNVVTWIRLNAGANTIKFYDSPLIDKIRVSKIEGGLYEAEDAWLTGTAESMVCSTSSNGQMVKNITNGENNSVEFYGVLVPESDNYILTISYMSPSDAGINIEINNQLLLKKNVTSTGSLCVEGTNMGTHSTVIPLNAGYNKIKIYDSPVLDKIEIKSSPSDARIATIENTTEKLESTSEDIFQVFPSTIEVGQPLTIVLNDSLVESGAYAQVIHSTGKVMTSSTIKIGENRWELPTTNLARGMHFLRVISPEREYLRRFIVK